MAEKNDQVKLGKADTEIRFWQNRVEDLTGRDEPLAKIMLVEADRQLEYWSDVYESLNVENL